MDRKIESVAAVIAYIEDHLDEKLSLDMLAGAACYSKYHLHRMFMDTLGITPHDYIQRRQLTEAARLLTCSDSPILDIALSAGYESQQAFTSVFKAMYKRTPLEYRQGGTFYPLQLPFTLNPSPSSFSADVRKISYARPEDLPGWMDLVSLVIAGFPCLDTSSHREEVRRYIRQRQALIMRDGSVIIGAALFSARRGNIDFLAVHPQYRRQGVSQALLRFLFPLLAGRDVTITTFREGDRADTGQRAEYQHLGFTGAELLTEFGYPTQRLILPKDRGEGLHG